MLRLQRLLIGRWLLIGCWQQVDLGVLLWLLLLPHEALESSKTVRFQLDQRIQVISHTAKLTLERDELVEDGGDQTIGWWPDIHLRRVLQR